ncbi:MAG TPA: PepSY-associated TM helix domain-containing protein [Gammaproteobacteria bacterium]|nr:PepSY-associated TM helix domain-containing protein [Gammaproteobacteria bacterium]
MLLHRLLHEPQHLWVRRALVSATDAAALEVVMAPGGVRQANEVGYVSLYFDRHDGALLERRNHAVASAGDWVMAWVGTLHTGSFGGWPVKIPWFVLGLAPPLLVVTGVLMWWNRVVRKKLARLPS